MDAAHYDLIIVGAGPGGAMAAWTAARGGLRVLLLDKAAELPRYKPCGGGIPASLLRHIPELDPSRFVDVNVTRLRHSWKGRATATGELAAGAAVMMVQRPRFDKYLVDQAVAAGATLLVAAKARAVKIGDSLLSIELFDGRLFHGRFLIGADGATGIISAQLGLRRQKRQGIAREIELPISDGTLDANTAYLEYGTVRNGYAWIFPKHGTLSVGAGILLHQKNEDSDGEQRAGELLKKAIAALLDSVGVRGALDAAAPRMWAHPIPEWSGSEPLTAAQDRALLVGDAAGIVQPLFGEGIQYAMRTGVLAARCILLNEVSAYTARVRALFAADFDAAARVSRVFYRLPSLVYHLGIRRPVGARLVSRILSGETSFAQIEDRLYERLRKVLPGSS